MGLLSRSAYSVCSGGKGLHLGSYAGRWREWAVHTATGAGAPSFSKHSFAGPETAGRPAHLSAAVP